MSETLLLEFCKYNNIRIISLEAFRITPQGIQQSQNNSIYLDCYEDTCENVISFLCEKAEMNIFMKYGMKVTN